MRKESVFKFVLLTTFFIVTSCSMKSKRKRTNASEKKIEVKRDTGLSIFQLASVWEDQNGKKLQLKELQGNVLVIVMIYTSCKTACPILVADMKDLKTKVNAPYDANLRYILVSIDPKTDTPKRLKEFALQNKMNGQQWLLLRGSEESTREFANVLAVKYTAISPVDFSHSNIISVFDKNGVMQSQTEGLALNNNSIIQVIKQLL